MAFTGENYVLGSNLIAKRTQESFPNHLDDTNDSCKRKLFVIPTSYFFIFFGGGKEKDKPFALR